MVRHRQTQPEKPWWDWMGVTEKQDEPRPVMVRRRVAQPASSAEKPWWDWMGVTQDSAPAKRRGR
jgi:hypothetical protein